MGRFLSPDEPFADQFESDPQSWNLYSYVRNNPLAMVDPEGRDALWVDDNRTGQTTLRIPVRFTGAAATQQNVDTIVKRANSLTVEGSSVRIEVIATDEPIHGVLNTLDFSPVPDVEKYPRVGEGAALGGTEGHIDSSQRMATGAAVHDTLHFAGSGVSI